MNEIEGMIHQYATEKGFRLIGNASKGDLRIYFRESPEASARMRLEDAEHAMMRSADEFYRFLDRVFDK